MKLLRPEYCSSFSCLGSLCSDNCCIGWEIDIDTASYNKYIERGLAFTSVITPPCEGALAHFITDEHGRCPFLRPDNLCTLICESGHSYIPEICREHPRYYNIFPNFAEGGIGLACEEAARLILMSEFPVKFVSCESAFDCDDEVNLSVFSYAQGVREKIFELLYSNNYPVDILSSLVNYAGQVSDVAFDIEAGISSALPPITGIPIQTNRDDLFELLSRFYDTLPRLEALTDDLAQHVRGISAALEDKAGFLDFLSKTFDKYLRRLLFYFIHRYFLPGVYDSTLGERILFAVGSALSIAAVTYTTDSYTLQDIVNIAKGYSKNLEYSTENIDLLLDFLTFFAQAFFTANEFLI